MVRNMILGYKLDSSGSGQYRQRTLVNTAVNFSFTYNSGSFCMYIPVVGFSPSQDGLCCVYSADQLGCQYLFPEQEVFVMEILSVFCEVGTWFLNVCYLKLLCPDPVVTLLACREKCGSCKHNTCARRLSYDHL